MQNKKTNNIISRNISLYTLFSVFVFMFSFSSIAVFAEDVDDIFDDLKEISDKKAKYQQLNAVKENEKALIDRQIRTINSETASIEKDIEETKETLEKTDKEIDRIRKGVEEQQRTLLSQKTVLKQLIRIQYEIGQKSISSIFSSYASLQDSDYVIQTQNKVHETMSRITKLREKMQTDREKLEKEKDTIADEKQKLEQRTEYLESTKSYKSYLSLQTQKDISKYQKKISKLESQEIEMRREIEKIEIGKLSDVNLADLPSSGEADFRYPVDKPIRITQSYGVTSFSKTAYKSGRHNGTDFGLGKDKIRAVADGKVIATGNMGRYGYGKWIAIDHKNGLVTLYGHLSKIKVDHGDKVDKDDRIGTMGTTGYSTGVHLHFTVFAASTFEIVNSSSVSGLRIPTGASVNPMIYL